MKSVHVVKVDVTSDLAFLSLQSTPLRLIVKTEPSFRLKIAGCVSKGEIMIFSFVFLNLYKHEDVYITKYRRCAQSV